MQDSTRDNNPTPRQINCTTTTQQPKTILDHGYSIPKRNRLITTYLVDEKRETKRKALLKAKTQQPVK
jgi:hypothetical protein